MKTGPRLDVGVQFLLIAVGLAAIVAGFVMGPPAGKTLALVTSASAKPVPSGIPPLAARVIAGAETTYCPGPDCVIERPARDYCQRLSGAFVAAPDFTCALEDGVHRIVCDDIPDEHQCGHMGHTDVEYARYQMEEFWRRYPRTEVDIFRDALEGTLACEEFQRFVVCHFSNRETHEEHVESPVSCNWSGCVTFREQQEGIE